MLVVTIKRHEGIPKLIGMLPEMQAMAPLVIWLRVTLRVMEATTMRLLMFYDVIGNFIYLDFEQYAWPAQGPCYPGPVQASDIIILDIPWHDVTEVSLSSYSLSLFSLKASSHPKDNAGATRGESSSVSVGELWSGIDLLDEAGLEGISVVPMQERWGVKHHICAQIPKDQEEKVRVACA
jgi:hypothetical protein